jgi:hypothetical protein
VEESLQMSEEKMVLQEAYDENGKAVSPVLTSGRKNFLIDIDGTICEDIPNEQPERMVDCKPFLDALHTINKWYDQGHVIYFFSSRTESLREITENWLQKHGFKYHGILFGKPRGGNYHWIDNHIVRATRFLGKFGELVRAKKEIEVFEE